MLVGILKKNHISTSFLSHTETSRNEFKRCLLQDNVEKSKTETKQTFTHCIKTNGRQVYLIQK